jgi:ribosomal protein S18 acetylase RimI-like enzyme
MPLYPVPESIKDQIRESVVEFFGTDSDPTQLHPTDETRRKYYELHPHAVVYEATPEGILMGWVSGFPTTRESMDQFLSRAINEQELFGQTEKLGRPQFVYMQTALVLPDYRNQGLGFRLSKEFIQNFLDENPACQFYIWEFSPEGKALADKLERELEIKILRSN